MANRTQIKRARDLLVDGDKPNAALSYRRLSRALKHRYRHWLADNPDFVGLGVGEKTSSGVGQSYQCLKVYVIEKKAKRDVQRNRLIPKFITIEGVRIPTDVETVGIPAAQFTFARPGFGVTIGKDKWGVGKYACAVRELGTGPRSPKYLLSCSHVIAANGGVPGTPVFVFDSDAARRVGQLRTFAPLHFDKPHKTHTVDAAIAIATPPPKLANIVLGKPHIKKLATGVRTGAAVAVFEQGEARVGKVENTSFSGRFRFRSPAGEEVLLWFRDVVKCSRYSEAGDSGALIVTGNGGLVAGLHFAGSDSASFFIKAKTVFDKLKIKLA